MAVNDAFAAAGTAVADTNSFTADGSSGGTGAAEIQQVIGDAACEIYLEMDPDGDSTFEVSVLIDSFSGGFHSQLNAILVSSSQNVRIRVKNTSGSSANFAVIGLEVNN